MNIIDMHTHTFPDKIAEKVLAKLSKMSGTCYFTDGTEGGLVTSEQTAGISYSVILPVATSAEQVEKINDGVIAQQEERFAKGIISFGAMHPDFTNPKTELKRLADAGIKGIKLHPAYTATNFDDVRHIAIIDAAAENNLAVTVHAGIDIGIPEFDYCDTQMVLHVLKKVPGAKLILAHMGGWIRWEQVKKDLAGAPLYFDTSFSFGPLTPRPDRTLESIPPLMTPEAFTALCHHLGCEKILFGTDSPWGDQKADVERLLSLSLTDAEKKMILYGNAQKLLGL